MAWPKVLPKGTKRRRSLSRRRRARAALGTPRFTQVLPELREYCQVPSPVDATTAIPLRGKVSVSAMKGLNRLPIRLPRGLVLSSATGVRVIATRRLTVTVAALNAVVPPTAFGWERLAVAPAVPVV